MVLQVTLWNDDDSKIKWKIANIAEISLLCVEEKKSIKIWVWMIKKIVCNPLSHSLSFLIAVVHFSSKQSNLLRISWKLKLKLRRKRKNERKWKWWWYSKIQNINKVLVTTFRKEESKIKLSQNWNYKIPAYNILLVF